MDGMAAQPTEAPVHTCPGCGALVVDPIKHGQVCAALLDQREDGFGARIVEWLDSLDVEQLEADSIAHAGFDSNATEALMAELRKRAEAL